MDSVLSFKSEHTVYEQQIICSVKNNEFLLSYNPSLSEVSNDEVVLREFVSNSNFTPYITTIGLYNDDDELLAVAKLSQPIPKSSKIDLNFIIKLEY